MSLVPNRPVLSAGNVRARSLINVVRNQRRSEALLFLWPVKKKRILDAPESIWRNNHLSLLSEPSDAQFNDITII
jgi:hypothetical protein